MKFAGARRVASPVDVTPLIDIIFQLVIFFMVSTNFVTSPGIEVELPRSSSNTILREQDDIKVWVKPDGQVWLDDSRPGEVTIVFVWPDQATWDAVGATDIQERLQAEFDERFARPYDLAREIHLERDGGLHRWSRFARP